MTRPCLVRWACAALAWLPACAPAPTPRATDVDTTTVTAEIAAQFDTLAQVVRLHDWDAVEARMSPGDVMSAAMDGIATRGRDEIMAAFRADSSVLSYVDYRFENTGIRALGADAAVHSTAFWERLALRSGDTVDIAGTWTN